MMNETCEVGIAPLRLAVCVAINFCLAGARADSVEPERCVRSDLPLDAREVEVVRSKEDDHPGLLSVGGYARAGTSMTKTNYTYVNAKRGGVIVEVGKHPADYPYVEHDLLGLFFRMSTPETRSLYTRSSLKFDADFKLVEWSRDPDGKARWIGWAVLDEGSEQGGVVGWCVPAGGSNGMKTVILRFTTVKLPERVIDKVMAENPGSFEPEIVTAAEWMNADLEKWIALLRTGPASEIELSVIGQAMRAYEMKAGEDWGADELWSGRNKADHDARVKDVAEKAEAWHRTHAFPL